HFYTPGVLFMNAKFSSSLMLQLVLLLGGTFAIGTSMAQEMTTETPAVTDSALPTAATPLANAASTESAPLDTYDAPSEQAAIDSATVDSTSMDTSSVANSDAAANAASAAEASTAEGHSQYGLGALWEQGDVIARGTLIIMILMSAATWYVLVTKLIQQQGLLSQARGTRKFWDSKDIHESLETYKHDSAFRAVAED